MNARRFIAVVALVCGATVASAQAQHAHVHGLLKLDLVIEGPTLTIEIDSPLDNLAGFERPPRNDAERKIVAQVVALLRTPGKLFRIDPAAGCKPEQIDLDAPVIGLGQAPTGGDAAHADLEGTFSFRCTDATKVRFVDLALFDAFRTVRQVDAQVASPQGQFQRTVTRPSDRLRWGR